MKAPSTHSLQAARILVASQNPVKLAATKQGFRALWPQATLHVDGASFPSGVSEQPLSNQETYTGAHNRAKHAYEQYHHTQQRQRPTHETANEPYDFYVGIEGGIDTDTTLHAAPHDTCLFTWVVIYNHHGIMGKARTSPLFLPPRIVELVQQGHELGTADDIVFGTTNSKQKNGTLGILTDNAIDRTQYTAQAVTLACVPFYKPDLY